MILIFTKFIPISHTAVKYLSLFTAFARQKVCVSVAYSLRDWKNCVLSKLACQGHVILKTLQGKRSFTMIKLQLYFSLYHNNI
jgi:hypothetical protein